MGSRELKKAATRTSLVDAAARLFTERGVDGTTMDDIARAAGTSRTSVFNYFGYKEMILCEIGARYVAEIAGTGSAAARRSPRRRLLDMADTLAEIAMRDPQLVAAVSREMTHPDSERRQRAAETMRYGEIIDQTMDALSEAGALRDVRLRDSYARMIVDLVAGALVRAGGD
ncbi:MAG TPA: helix-turn-helix domain-containing protein, partial [Candidatus Limnocylindria bacterium]